MPGMKVFLQVLVAIPVLLITLWGVLALYFAGPDPAWLRPALASLFGVGTLALLVCLRPYRLALGIWAAAVVLLMFWWTTLQPSNDRNWQPDVARLPTGEIQGNKLTIRNLRNVDYRTETDYTVRYEDRTYDLSRLTGLDLFMIYWGSPAIAHTIMSWQFEGSLPLAVSIETRKQVGQEYSALEGFFKQYEIIYVVADERDVVRVRTNYRGEDVYLYRVRGPVENRRRLFLEYVRAINALRDEPRFYDTLTTNCTTTILLHTRVNPGHLPLSWKVLLSGHAAEYVWEQGRLDTSLSFAELERRSRINDAARAANQSADFSRRIREGLPGMSAVAGGGS